MMRKRPGSLQKKKPDDNDKRVPEWAPHRYKHFPKKNMPWKDTIKATKRPNSAKYKSDINIESLGRTAWKEGQPVKCGKPWKVFKADHIIGAKDGMETPYMRVEISSNTIHGHPITPAE